MTGERKFIRENINRVLIKEFMIKKIEGAGFGGMNIQRTPMGTRINIVVERPGMVIGKSGSKIKELTEDIKNNFKSGSSFLASLKALTSVMGSNQLDNTPPHRRRISFSPIP